MPIFPHHQEAASRLATATRERLNPAGFDDYKIERLAEAFLAEGRDEDADRFVEWAIAHVIEEDHERRSHFASDDAGPTAVH